MQKIGLNPIEGSSTFYFFVSISPSKLNSVDFCTKLLQEEYIAVVPGIGYGESCDKFIRVSIGVAPMDEIKRGLLKIKELIDKTK
jgi:aspartate aminotransferase/aminotransferase